MDWELKQKLIRVAQYAYQYKLDEHDFTIVQDNDWERDGNSHSKSTIIHHFGKYYRVYQLVHASDGYIEFYHEPTVSEVARKEVTTVKWVNV